MITHSKEFDEDLRTIEHYLRFPAMKPYIGENYGKNGYPRILLIGESNYLPKKSEIHKDAKLWYEADQSQLVNEEVNWVHCRQLLECDWKSHGHKIYRELESNLKKHFKNYNNQRAMTNVAYINGFQRPSPETGESINKFLKPIDYKISSDVLSRVVKIIDPDIIIFVSKLAWDRLRWKLNIDKKVKIDFTCHPGTGGLYWHNKNYMHGRKKFNDLLKILLNSNYEGQ